MPRIAKEENGRILHPDYTHAYLKVRDGRYHTVIHDIAKSTGINAVHSNKKSEEKAIRSAMGLLQDRLDDYLIKKKHPDIVVNKPKVLTPSTSIVEIALEYVKQKKSTKHVSADTIKHLVSTFRVYFSKDFTISQTHEIRSFIVAKTLERNYKESTVNKHYSRLHSFFDWCIKADYCSVNPMDAIQSPHIPQPDIVFPTWAEFNAVTEYYRQGLNYKRYPVEREANIRFWRLLATTGMRIGEAIKLRIDDLQQDGFVIDGKRKHYNESKQRWFIHDIVPGSRELIDECRQFAQNDGQLFSWHSYQKPASNWRDCIRALQMDERYTMHSLRRLAKWWWEVELGIPPHIANMLAGHSFAVRTKYHRQATIDDLKKYIKTSGIRQE